jgi:hypothetical protein
LTWLLTSSGREHALTGLRATAAINTPTLREIGHSLAHINRFTGHARRAYSVAEHSILVMEIAARHGASQLACLAALMHDAHECITGDVASPVKVELGDAWHVFESKHQNTLLTSYGLLEISAEHHAIVKHADLVALATERRDLTMFDPKVNTPWPVLDTPGAKILPFVHVDLNSRWRCVQAMYPTEIAQEFENIATALFAKLIPAPTPATEAA